MEHPDLAPDDLADATPPDLCLSDLLAHRSLILWHEAVNVVLGIAETIEADRASATPLVEAVFLEAGGTIRIAAYAPGGPPPVAQLRGWLKDLLQETPAPPPLADLADADESPGQKLGEFIDALRYFSRPNRCEELETLARRIRAQDQVAPLEQELAALTARITRPAPRRPEPGWKRSAPWLWNLVTAVGRHRILVVAVAGTLLALAFPTNVRRAPGERGLQPPDTGLPAVPAAPRVVPAHPLEIPPVGPPVLSYDSRGAARPPAAADTRDGKNAPSRQAAPQAELRAPAMPRLDAVPVRPAFADSMPGARIAGEATPEAAAPTSAPAEPARVFTPDDHEVVQPALLSSYLPAPTVPGAVAAGAVTVVDVVIDEEGRVERATLASPSVRHDERMLLSAIKAWRFRPATRDGVPVKYRARLTLGS